MTHAIKRSMRRLQRPCLKLISDTCSGLSCAPGETSKGSTVPHPEEPARVRGVLRTSLEGSLPLGRPSEPAADG